MAKGQSLYDWCMKNGEWGQQLLYEFGDGNNSQQFTDKYGIKMSPHDFCKTTDTKIKWTCKDRNNIWYTRIHTRTINQSKCPVCSRENTRKKHMTSLYDWCMTNVRFVYIQEDSFNELDEVYNDDYICFHMGNTYEIKLKKLVEHIIKSLGYKITDIDIQEQIQMNPGIKVIGECRGVSP